MNTYLYAAATILLLGCGTESPGSDAGAGGQASATAATSVGSGGGGGAGHGGGGGAGGGPPICEDWYEPVALDCGFGVEVGQPLAQNPGQATGAVVEVGSGSPPASCLLLTGQSHATTAWLRLDDDASDSFYFVCADVPGLNFDALLGATVTVDFYEGPMDVTPAPRTLAITKEGSLVVYVARAWFDYPTPPAGFSFSPGTAICKSAETCFRLSRNLDVALGEESVSVAPGGFEDVGGHRVTLGSFADNSSFAQCVSDSSAFDLFVAIVPTGS